MAANRNGAALPLTRCVPRLGCWGVLLLHPLLGETRMRGTVSEKGVQLPRTGEGRRLGGRREATRRRKFISSKQRDLTLRIVP